LDGDGRVDLVVCTQEVWPEAKQTVQVFENRLKGTGHWIGFRFREQGNGNSPIGAQITITYNGHTTVGQIVTGDSHRSQHSASIHFGLGETDRVERVEVRWRNGKGLTLKAPGVDQYHYVSAPEKPSTPN
jgi:hypothetical protein